ncbi:protein transporter tim9 [Tilletia horrida]|uniref:Mitochondrial import inner membrane translocase subunit n=1 Tax=Tilletia horrida TaxID=155126 RepID=A0AAN6JLQ0_9BASI|nr:protein transporter tim9 [Tilletia horrida]KAK0537073.1 protein transporter tim9 [Tilletia horrida]KAK0538195.1 protein transporter tim9 [Tilletia horrida]KAK0560559.1 protein transporter tim9 [Tilletia horrida]
MDFSALSSSEQAAMQRIIEQRQMKDFMRLYTGLVERCFDACCNDFTSKALSTKEETCVHNCTSKWLKHSERVGARFQEENAKTMAAGAAGQRR